MTPGSVQSAGGCSSVGARVRPTTGRAGRSHRLSKGEQLGVGWGTSGACLLFSIRMPWISCMEVDAMPSMPSKMRDSNPCAQDDALWLVIKPGNRVLGLFLAALGVASAAHVGVPPLPRRSV
jgi:hypothetical protein